MCIYGTSKDADRNIKWILQHC